MSDRAAAIGIDIGGTGAKAGLVSQTGHIHARSSAPTSDSDDRPTVLGRYEEIIRDLLGQANAAHLRVSGIGVGLPGYLDEDYGTMTYGNVRCLEGFALRDYLAGVFGLNVRLDNDANCAALAEHYWGAGTDCDRLLVVTVGSGIGVGVIIGGQLLRYTFGTAGELGSIVVDVRGRKGAYLGGSGGLESVASARAMVEAARALDPPPADVATLASRARQEEPAAAIIRRPGRWLGVGVASWAAIFCPQKVLIGGGVAACGDLFFDAVRRSVRLTATPFYVRKLSIEPARLGNSAGFMGAASLILKNPN